MRVITYLRTTFAKAIVAAKDDRLFSPAVKKAAARVDFRSASVGGLSWFGLFGFRNDLRLAIAKVLLAHGVLPTSGPIKIDEFETRDEKVRFDLKTAGREPRSYIVTNILTFTYNGKKYPLPFSPIFKSSGLHYDYSLKGDSIFD